MPFLSPSACLTACPSAMPTSSVVWWWSMWRSPRAVTLTSMREWRARRSSMWSRKPMPVETVALPVPSRSTATSTSVSFVVRRSEALRMARPFVKRRPSIRRTNPAPPRPRIIVDDCRRRPTLMQQAGPAAFASLARRAYIPSAPAIHPMQNPQPDPWHATTILTVRKGGIVAIGGDGQVSIGQTIIKGNAKKVRRLGKGDVIGGFAGATADAFTLFERLEAKLEQYPGQLTRAAVELAKDWRTDRYLRRLEAMMIVADAQVSLVLTGTGDVLEPEAGVMGIGSGGNYALAAARAMMDGPLDAEAIVRKAMDIAADICVYTNRNVTIEKL